MAVKGKEEGSVFDVIKVEAINPGCEVKGAYTIESTFISEEGSSNEVRRCTVLYPEEKPVLRR